MASVLWDTTFSEPVLSQIDQLSDPDGGTLTLTSSGPVYAGSNVLEILTRSATPQTGDAVALRRGLPATAYARLRYEVWVSQVFAIDLHRVFILAGHRYRDVNEFYEPAVRWDWVSGVIQSSLGYPDPAVGIPYKDGSDRTDWVTHYTYSPTPFANNDWRYLAMDIDYERKVLLSVAVDGFIVAVNRALQPSGFSQIGSYVWVGVATGSASQTGAHIGRVRVTAL